MKQLILFLLIPVLFVSCAKAPPNLTPQSQIEFNKTRVIKGLDVLRDIAIASNNLTPPQLSTASTRLIVNYHTSAIYLISNNSIGWESKVEALLTEVNKNLNESERTLLSPYIMLLSTVLAEVVKS